MSLHNIYTNLNKTSFYICLICSIILLGTSFVLPPTGIIHPSTMEGVGELFAFATLGTVIEAIGRGVDAKLTHGKTEINLTNPDPENEKSDNL